MNKNAEKKLLKITQLIVKYTIEDMKFDNICIDEKEIEEIYNCSLMHKLENVIIMFLLKKFPNNSFLLEKKASIDYKTKIYLEALYEIISKLEENNIDYRLIKGFPLSKTIFGNPFIRRCADIDIIVKESDISKAFKLFRKLGYEQFDNEGTDEFIYVYSFDFHEIEMYKKMEGVEVWTELKRRSSAITSDRYNWFENCDLIMLNNISVKTQNTNNTIFHAFMNTFINNEDKYIYFSNYLRDYFDIAYLIKNRSIDWLEIFKLADSICSSHKIFEVLKSVEQLYPDVLTNCQYKLNDISISYELGLAYMRETTPDKYNSGLLAGCIKANAEYTIFDRDFKQYEFVKQYKAALFSLKNKEFVKRKILHAKTKWKKYNSTILKEDIWYRFKIDNDFRVEYRIKKDKLEYFVENNILPKFDWITCNFVSPELFVSIVGKKFEANFITEKIKADGWDFYSDKFKTENSEQFHSEVISIIELSYNAEYIYETFIINLDDIISSLPYVYTEVLMGLKHSEIILVDTEIQGSLFEIDMNDVIY